MHAETKEADYRRMKARAEAAEAHVSKIHAVVTDALHALAYGHTDVAMERLGKAVRMPQDKLSA